MKKFRIEDLETTHVSLVKKGANKTKFSIIKNEENNTVELNVDFLKSDLEKRLVTGLVYAPNEIDSHGHFMKAETIEKTAYNFMENYQKIDKDHNFKSTENKVVESWIAKEDMALNDTLIKKGSWLMTVKINDEETWEQVKKGEITGFSLAGRGRLIEEDNIKKGDDVAMSAELKKELEAIQKDFNDYKEKNSDSKITEIVKKELETLEESIKKSDKNSEEIEELKTNLKKADDLIKEIKMQGTIADVSKKFNDDDIAGALGEAYSHIKKNNISQETNLGDILEALEKSDNVIIKSMSTSNNQGAIKPFFVTKILEKVLETNSVAKYIPYLNITDNSVRVPKEESGIFEARWVDEDGERLETEGMEIGSINIELYQLYSLPIITNRLLGANFVQLGNYLMRRISQGFSQKISDAVWFGTGINQPKGIFNVQEVKDNAVTVTDLEFGFDKFLEVSYSLIEDYEGEAKWFMNKQTWSHLLSLKDNQGRYLTDITSAVNKTEQTMWNYPVEFNSSLPIFKKISVDDVPFALFGNIPTMMLGARNNNVTISIRDQIVKLGFTRFYNEIMIGQEVVDPNAGIMLTYKA